MDLFKPAIAIALIVLAIIGIAYVISLKKIAPKIHANHFQGCMTIEKFEK